MVRHSPPEQPSDQPFWLPMLFQRVRTRFDLKAENIVALSSTAPVQLVGVTETPLMVTGVLQKVEVGPPSAASKNGCGVTAAIALGPVLSAPFGRFAGQVGVLNPQIAVKTFAKALSNL